MKRNIINLCLLAIFMTSCSNDDSSFISLSSSNENNKNSTNYTSSSIKEDSSTSIDE